MAVDSDPGSEKSGGFAAGWAPWLALASSSLTSATSIITSSWFPTSTLLLFLVAH
jgi:hypothetical protein